MNAGTAVFLIVLVLIGSFAGLGYLINQNVAAAQDREAALTRSSELEAENARLRQQLTQCQTETTNLGQQVTQCTTDLGQAQAALRVCEQSPSPSPSIQVPAVQPLAAPAAQSGSGSNTITWLMLATVFITMVTGWGVVLRTVRLSQPERTHRLPPATEQPLTVRMTRRTDAGVRRLEAPQQK